MKRVSTPLQNNSGQGVIEFILVLVVTVGIVLGVIYQINDAFRSWASAYFGDYLTCLLETGELPTLGNNQQGLCIGPAFSITEGKPLNGSGVEQGDQGGGGGSGGNSDSSERNNGRATNASGNTAGAARPGSSSSSGRFRASRSSNAAGGAATTGEDGEKSSGTGELSAISVTQQAQRRGKAALVPIERGVSGQGIGSTRAEEERKKKTKVSTSVLGKNKVNRRALMKVEAPRKKDSTPPEIDDFTIGSFFRYLIIAAIIIILVLLLVLQGTEISKSINAE